MVPVLHLQDGFCVFGVLTLPTTWHCTGGAMVVAFHHNANHLCKQAPDLVEAALYQREMVVVLHHNVDTFVQLVQQCYYFFRRAHFCKKTGAFLAKIRALDGRKDGQNSSYVLKKRVNSTRDILTTKVRKSTQF